MNWDQLKGNWLGLAYASQERMVQALQSLGRALRKYYLRARALDIERVPV